MCGTVSRTLKGKTQLSTQIKFYKVMYGSENWSLNRSNKRKTEAAEMRFLRPMAGCTLWGKKRNSDIRTQMLYTLRKNSKVNQTSTDIKEFYLNYYNNSSLVQWLACLTTDHGVASSISGTSTNFKDVNQVWNGVHPAS